MNVLNLTRFLGSREQKVEDRPHDTCSLLIARLFFVFYITASITGFFNVQNEVWAQTPAAPTQHTVSPAGAAAPAAAAPRSPFSQDPECAVAQIPGASKNAIFMTIPDEQNGYWHVVSDPRTQGRYVVRKTDGPVDFDEFYRLYMSNKKSTSVPFKDTPANLNLSQQQMTVLNRKCQQQLNSNLTDRLRELEKEARSARNDYSSHRTGLLQCGSVLPEELAELKGTTLPSGSQETKIRSLESKINECKEYHKAALERIQDRIDHNREQQRRIQEMQSQQHVADALDKLIQNGINTADQIMNSKSQADLDRMDQQAKMLDDEMKQLQDQAKQLANQAQQQGQQQPGMPDMGQAPNPLDALQNAMGGGDPGNTEFSAGSSVDAGADANQPLTLAGKEKETDAKTFKAPELAKVSPNDPAAKAAAGAGGKKKDAAGSSGGGGGAGGASGGLPPVALSQPQRMMGPYLKADEIADSVYKSANEAQSAPNGSGGPSGAALEAKKEREPTPFPLPAPASEAGGGDAWMELYRRIAAAYIRHRSYLHDGELDMSYVESKTGGTP